MIAFLSTLLDSIIGAAYDFVIHFLFGISATRLHVRKKEKRGLAVDIRVKPTVAELKQAYFEDYMITKRDYFEGMARARKDHVESVIRAKKDDDSYALAKTQKVYRKDCDRVKENHDEHIARAREDYVGKLILYGYADELEKFLKEEESKQSYS